MTWTFSLNFKSTSIDYTVLWILSTYLINIQTTTSMIAINNYQYQNHLDSTIESPLKRPQVYTRIPSNLNKTDHQKSSTTSLYCPMISTILTPPSSSNLSSLSRKQQECTSTPLMKHQIQSPLSPQSLDSSANSEKLETPKIRSPYYQNVDDHRLNIVSGPSNLYHPIVQYQHVPYHQIMPSNFGYNSLNEQILIVI